MLVSYPAIFYFNKESEEKEIYNVYFPDLKGSGTQGIGIAESMSMASDYLGLALSDYLEDGERLPMSSNINELSIEDDFPFKDDPEMKDYYVLNKSFVSMVVVDLREYLDSSTLIKKTLSIPKWANDVAVKYNINFSQLLTNAIAEETIKYK